MKNQFKTLTVTGVVLALLLAYAAVVGFSDNTAGAAVDTSKSSLSVNGQGKVNVKPDMAYITVGVTSQAKTARDAQIDNNKKMSRVIAALKGIAIKEDDIRTVNYDLSPRYEYSGLKTGEQKQQLVGYTATNRVQVLVRDINAVGKALDVVVTAGANLSGGINFTLSEARMDKAYADALMSALKNAKGKADVLAKGIGVTLDKPKEINEGGGVSIPPVYREFSYAKMADEAASQVPVAAGQLEVSASVGLRYEY